MNECISLCLTPSSYIIRKGYDDDVDADNDDDDDHVKKGDM